MLTSVNDLDGFGYWRLLDSSITLTNQPLSNATLDLVVENMSRNNFGLINQFQQFKGLIDDVSIDKEIVYNWEIIPLEFKKSWTKKLSGWHTFKSSAPGPALYRASFNVTFPLRDTYINVQDWNMGIAIINGFVLGRIFSVGPQQALYLPAGLLQAGINEILIFEHFKAPKYLKFSKEHIWGYGNNIQV